MSPSGPAGGVGPGAPTRRLFAALVPPPVLAEALARAAREALATAADDLRFYPPEHVHVTLCFLGAVDDTLLPALDRALGRAARAAGPIELALHGGGGFPSPRAARVVWAGVADGGGGALAALQARAAEELAAAGAVPVEGDRPFVPHLTLARARAPIALPAAFAGLTTAPPIEPRWTARELLLVESRLERPAAERYPVLVRHALGPRRGTESGS